MALEILTRSRAALAALSPFEVEAMDACCHAIADDLSLKGRQYFGVMRAATTGQTVSPPLFESMEILGQPEVLRRIDVALAKLAGA